MSKSTQDFGKFYASNNDDSLFVDIGKFEINPLLLKEHNKYVQVIHLANPRNMFNTDDYDIYFGQFVKYDKESGDIWYEYMYDDDKIPEYHTLIFHKPSSTSSCCGYKWFTVEDTQSVICSKSYKQENYKQEMYKVAKMMYLHHSHVIINESLNIGNSIFIESWDDNSIDGCILVCTKISADRKSAEFIDIKKMETVNISVNDKSRSDLRFVKLICE